MPLDLILLILNMYLPKQRNFRVVGVWLIRIIISTLVYYSGAVWLYVKLRQVFEGTHKILILGYHRINEREYGILNLSVSQRIFEAQIEFLQKSFNLISLEEACQRIKKNTEKCGSFDI